MVEFITDFIGRHGAWAIAALMFAENIFPPIPSELIMPFAGFAASRGDVDPTLAVLAGTAGSVCGALPWFLLARHWGARRLRTFAERHGHWLAMSGSDVDRAGEWFHRHGPAVLVFGRLLPGVRTLLAFPAGFCGMPLAPFVAWSALGSALWCALLLAAGWWLEERYDQFARVIEVAAKVVFAALAGAYLLRVARARRR